MKKIYILIFLLLSFATFGQNYNFVFNEDKMFITYSKTSDSTCAMIYFVFNCGHNESVYFPIYINEQYISTISGNQRLAYKMFTEGDIEIQRKMKKNVGPVLKLNIKRGNSYYIYIKLKNSYAKDFNDRFSFVNVDDILEQKDYRSYFNIGIITSINYDERIFSKNLPRFSSFKKDTKFVVESDKKLR